MLVNSTFFMGSSPNWNTQNGPRRKQFGNILHLRYICWIRGNILHAWEYIYTFKKNVLTENTVGTNDFNLIASWGT